MVNLINIIQQQSLKVTLRVEDAKYALGFEDILADELPS